MNKKLTDAIKAGIQEYTDRKVVSLKFHEDSVGAIAIRAELEEDRSLDFLIASFDVEKCKDATSTANHLEECEFKTWPPQESGPKFV